MAFAEAPIGMAVSTPDGMILDVNQAYLEMLGYTKEELLAHDSSHFTHPADVEPTRQFLAILLLAALRDASRKTGVLEKRYLRKNGTILWARASVTIRLDEHGQPLELIAIIEDITERKRAEERLRAIYDSTYEYIGLLSPDGTVLDTNQASLQFAGNTRADVAGKPFWEAPWFSFTPGASEHIRQSVSRAATGEFVRYEAELRRPSGEYATFDISLHPIRNDQGEVILIVPEGRDITDLKALEARNAFLVRLDDASRPLTDPHTITQTAAGLLGAHLKVNRCAYADVEEDEDTFNLTGDYTSGVPSIVGRFTFAQFGSECLRLMREGEPCVIEDSEADPRTADGIDAYRLTSIRSAIWVPLLKSGRLVAAMAVHQVTSRQWTQNEVELVQLVASRCWESIERVHVTRELRHREQRFRFLAESIPNMVWTATADGMVDYVSSQAVSYFALSDQGLSEEILIGSGWLNVVHPEERDTASARWSHSIVTGEPYETSLRLRRGTDRSWRWHLARAVPLTGADGKVLQWFGTWTDIEEQKQAETSLRQQWKTFDTALSHTPDFAYIFDLDGRFTYANRALLALWNLSFEEAQGKNFFELNYPPDLAERLMRQIQIVIDTRQPLRDQTPFQAANGETGHYDYIFVPVFDENGRVEAVAGSTRDITEQTYAEQQIEADRRRWRELLLQTPAAIAVLRGPSHRFEWINADYQRLIARPAERVIGRTVAEALPELEGQRYLELLNGVYQTGVAYHGHEAPVQLEDGDGQLQNVFLNFVYLPTRDLDGNIDGIFVHSIDVTDMVLARKQVEERELQFRTLAETIPHLAWMADTTGHIFWYNRRWYDYTGTTLDQMKGWGWQTLHDPAILPEVIQKWRVALGSGEPFEMVFPLRGSDGSFRSFLTRVEPVRDSEGHVVRWFGTNTDITEQRRVEDELRRINRELEEFAYVASHDLQEPLRMVNIYTHLILKKMDHSDETLKEFAGFVRQGVLRMEALIRDLLSFSRAVHQEEEPAGSADLSMALSEAMSVLKPAIEESSARISWDPLPATRGETSQLAHVFQNILSNAIKYHRKNVKPVIWITAEAGEKQTTVSVRDNGIGFDPQYSERIFGLFKRLHKDAYPGTGLGLAICRRIIERYGGRIWAEGRPGVGATFHFSLPHAEEP